MTLLRPGRSSAATRKRGRVADLRARLAARPDSEHEQAVIRIVIVSLLLGPFVLLATLLEEPHGFGQGALLAAVYLVLSLGYLGWIVFEPGISRLRRVLGMVTDHTALSLVVLYGGPWVGALYPIYLWITFGNGFRFGNQYLGAAAGYSFVAFSAAAWLNPFWHDNLALTTGLALGLVVLPGYVASLIRKLTEAKRTAEAANRAKSRFLATMSHELRTPLNAVIGFADMIAQRMFGPIDTRYADYGADIKSSGEHLLGIIDDVLDLSRIEADAMTLHEEPVDLGDVADGARKLVGGQARAAGVPIENAVPKGTAVRADSQRVRQLLVNLLSNAIKHSTADTPVEIRIDRRIDGIALEVVDQGVGIAEDQLQTILEPFGRAETATVADGRGVGLGLPLCRRLIELHGGRLEIDSTPGVGTVVSVVFPGNRTFSPPELADARPNPS